MILLINLLLGWSILSRNVKEIKEQHGYRSLNATATTVNFSTVCSIAQSLL